MSFYRNIDVRMWGDAKFKSLSAGIPNAQSLWLHLLTGPHTGPVPGLFRLGKASLAESLDWSEEDTLRCFAELEAAGMARADWRARVVWLPKALRHNPPDNPNVVKGWLEYVDAVPESALTTEAVDALCAAMLERGEPFAKPLAERFPERFPKPFAKPSPKPLAKRYAKQEEEQEEEEEQEQEGSGEDSPGAAAPAPPVAEVGLSEPVAAARAALQQASGVEYPVASFAKLDRAVRRKQVAPDDLALVVRWVVGHEFWRTQPPSVLFRREKFAELLAQARAGPPKRDGPPQPTIRKIKGVAEALAT